MLPPLIPSLIARPAPQQPSPSPPPPSPLGAVTRAGISGAGAMMRSGADLFLAPAQRVVATHAALAPALIRHGTTHIQQRVSPITDRVDAAAARAAPAVRLGATTLGYGVGSAVDVVTAPTRATIAPNMPLAREQFARHPEQMAKGALIGAGIISGVAGGATLLAGRGAASVAGPAAASTIARTGGAAGIGHATGGAVAPAAVDAIIKAATVGTVAGAAAHLATRATTPAHHSAHISIPTGNPDWVDRWRDPHGGIGSRGGEIPRPDWMRGDPEVPLSPGVDWRAPEEDLSDYLDYLDKTRSGHPPARGPIPYYQGPEIQQPGAGTRQITSPELTPAPDYHGAPEILIGRTIHAPEIEPRPAIFPGELTTPTGPSPFPAELPDPRRHQTPDILRDLDDLARPPLHPLGDPVSPTWRTPDYSDQVAHALPVAGASAIVDRGGITTPLITDDLDLITRDYGLGGYIAGTPIATTIQPDIDLSTWTKKLTITEAGTLPGTATVPLPAPALHPPTIPGFALGTEIQPDIDPSTWANILTIPGAGTLPGTATGTLPATAARSLSLTGTRAGTQTTPDTRITDITIPEIAHPDITAYHYPPDTPVAFPPEFPPEFLFAPPLTEQTRRRSQSTRKKKRKSSPDPAGWGFWETLRVATPAEFLGIGSGRRTTRPRRRTKR